MAGKAISRRDSERRFASVADIEVLSKRTEPLRTHRLLLHNRPMDLSVHQIPIKYLYFSIANGRYADRMIRLKAENPGIEPDPRDPEMRDRIQELLMGNGKLADSRDKEASNRLLDDIKDKTQIVPGIVAHDGGVLDGNRRLAVLIELGWEYFDGVILPKDTSDEDKWRIEAGQQMGKPLIHAYSPMNELLKIREGIDLFRHLKKEGNDPSPKKTPEDLVAETLYGRERKEIDEMLRRLELIEEYLDYIGFKGRFDMMGDRAERFKEILQSVEDAKKAGLPPKDLAKTKAWLFNLAYTQAVDNWELRDIRKAIPGNSGTGRPLKKSKKAQRMLSESLPPHEELRKECREMAVNRKSLEEYSTERKDNHTKKAVQLAEDVVTLVREEQRRPDPLRLIGESKTKLETIKEQLPKVKEEEQRKIKAELESLLKLLNELLGQLKRLE